MMQHSLEAIVLAAGKGTRMGGQLPKVCQPLAHKPLLLHVLDALKPLLPEAVTVVVGEQMPQVQALCSSAVQIATQRERLGTAHAVQQAVQQYAPKAEFVAVLFGDTPLLRPQTMQAMAAALSNAPEAGICVLGFDAHPDNAYGRLIVEQGQLRRIVETAEATAAEKQQRLCNAGIMMFRSKALSAILPRIDNKNSKGEYYLTDAIAHAYPLGWQAITITADAAEVLGVNTYAELAAAEAVLQTRLRQQHLANGVRMPAPDTVYFAADTRIARGVVIEPFVVFAGGVEVEESATIRSFSHLDHAYVGEGAIIGPYARLRPKARIGAAAHIGNFVEVKNAQLGNGAKANHLTYLGDATIGAGSNIGAGTITCNYDGYAKHQTTIGDNVFIGSDTSLVAPVSVGDGAIIGAGSVITADVPANALALSRAQQESRVDAAKRFRTTREKK